jgi:branched-chain amino acid transport system ATP-binding protein
MLLEVEALEAGYGTRPVLMGVSAYVGEGEIVALIGHNGSAKSTLLKAVYGLVRIFGGQIRAAGRDITHIAGPDRTTGLAYVPQGGGLFPDLTVSENLWLACHGIRARVDKERRIDEVALLFPRLRERREQLAGTLSGGEQQMLSVAMALVRRPKIMLLDEPSVGLSPVLVEQMLGTIAEIRQRLGCSVLIAEQNVRPALKIADRVYVMKLGQFSLEQRSADLLARDDLWSLF